MKSWLVKDTPPPPQVLIIRDRKEEEGWGVRVLRRSSVAIILCRGGLWSVRKENGDPRWLRVVGVYMVVFLPSSSHR